MRDEGYLLSRDGIEKIRADHRARRGRISSIDEMKRRRYDTFELVPMIVTQARSSSTVDRPFGAGENAFVNSDWVSYSSGLSSPVSTCFTARPYADSGVPIIANGTDMAARYYGSIGTTLATVPDVNVSARLINGVVFTGQLITVGIVGQNFTEDLSSQVIGDVLNGSTGTVFYGKVATDVTTSDSSFCYVDVYYRQWFSTMAKLRPTTCRVLAYNDTGISLVNGQVVRLEHLAEHSPAMPFATSKNIGRWIVTDYRCAT